MSKKYKNSDERMKDIRRYLDGDMTGRERNSFEKKLQVDPFEEEAFEGLSNLSSGELEKDIDILDARLKRRVHKGTPFYYRIAAAVVVLMAISSLFLVKELRKPAMMMSENVAEYKDTLKEEHLAPMGESVGKAKEDLSESAAGQEARSAVVQEEDPVIKETATLDDEIVLDPEEEQERVEIQKVITTKIEDSIVMAEDLLADEVLRKVRVAEAIEEEEAIEALKAKKSMQPAAPAKAEEQADKEVIGISLREEEEVSDTGILADRSAEPFGGIKDFKTYLQTDQIFPADWDVSDKEIVKLEITIEITGEIRNIKIIKSPGAKFSEEAIRLIKEGPPWLAATKNSQKVEDIVKLRIVFKK